MKKHFRYLLYLFATSFAIFFSSTSFAAEWNCLGNEQYNSKDYERKTTVSYTNDLCIRLDDRPLRIDVYLHKIKFSGSTSNTLDIYTIVKVTHNDTGEVYIQSGLEKYNKVISEYKKEYTFPVSATGKYTVEVIRVDLTMRKNGKPTGAFNNIDVRKGTANITPLAMCQ